jgi:hypothetical protein
MHEGRTLMPPTVRVLAVTSRTPCQIIGSRTWVGQ